ncbi:DUF883 family protein [Diaphorobacter caeni]|uniref:DUF883 family protein n=1 Tax=Diaphorobacter caeni TaxID=2784387 RepID=UPI00188E0E07|nr:DUF883 family protein [Diaphorobacter caeni]MBF5006628.1 DUF883 domain-containing protein [Diaphorobacter caeni]
MQLRKRNIANAKSKFEDSVDSLKEVLANKDFDHIPEVKELRQKLEAGMGELEDSASDMMKQARRKGAKIARNTNAYVHDDPWPVVGTAVALGVLAGFLITKR